MSCFGGLEKKVLEAKIDIDSLLFAESTIDETVNEILTNTVIFRNLIDAVESDLLKLLTTLMPSAVLYTS